MFRSLRILYQIIKIEKVTPKQNPEHLIASQTRRSFYAIAPADVPTPEKLAQVFARAREQSPSILFIDEIDGLLPRGDNGYFQFKRLQADVHPPARGLIQMSADERR